jgi:hypothetical protein
VKAQCERCKEIVALELAVEGEGIRARCPACKASYVVAPAAPKPPASPAGMVCPKCGEEQKVAEACRKCGLVIANWKGEELEGGELGERFAKAATDAEHEAFIEEARRRGMLAYAAARYRQKGDRQRLEQIRRIAEQSLAVAPRREVKPARSRTVLLVVMIVVVLVMGWVLMQGYSVPE